MEVSNDTGGGFLNNTVVRKESELEVKAYLQNLRYALDNGAEIKIIQDRKVDIGRDVQYTNRYTLAKLFPDEAPEHALRRELKTLTVSDYLRTEKDTRFKNLSEWRVFGKTYNNDEEVYIKIRVELLAQQINGHATTVMSFHFAITAFKDEVFPYQR